ncbi:MAG TPA: cobalamin-binding protein [Candidatus Limnocylindrales bacterium]|nr:cobalamin-binding protein [Candidatus Limnocylindrales bacterium]
MTRGPFVDATGHAVHLPAPPRRIVSLVPSITETLFALGLGDAVAGCTIYCTQPAAGVAGKTRVGGEKDPKLDVIRALAPDLVVANVEENVREHVETLRGWDIPVYVVYPRTVAEGIRLVRELGDVTGAVERGTALTAELEDALERVRAGRTGAPPARVFCPIWRRPYMTINEDTYVHDMLAVCGGANVFAGLPTRYPAVTLAEVAMAMPEVILLPDEPYRFRRAHLADFAPYPEVPAVRDGRIHLMDGKLLSWYGPRIAEALSVLPGFF